MKKLSLHTLGIHLDIEKLPTVTFYAILGVVAICVIGMAWYGYTNVYTPYTNETVAEEKLNQKQDKLNVKNFEVVREQLLQKQTGKPDDLALDPFSGS